MEEPTLRRTRSLEEQLAAARERRRERVTHAHPSFPPVRPRRPSLASRKAAR